MCGIIGIVKENCETLKPVMGNMIDVLKHRGPDENGIKCFDNCILGHVRLSIIDLKSGQQPMKSPVSNNYIVFNGEIYGYKDIKENLNDYPFKTSCDTEVILALYDKYGVEMMQHLPGAFAFAIWDESKNRLFMARDRFGEKPLFYALGKDNEFIFASEIKSILESGLIDVQEIDKDALAHYLQFDYVQPNKTIYNNIFVLPPAHSLIFENGQIAVKRYWQVPDLNEEMTEEEANEGFKELFAKAVKKLMIADVDIGTFLSGGLDSSSIVAELSNNVKNLMTISFGFDNTSLNELPYAKEVANMYNTKHIEMSDNRDDLADLFVEMAKIQDEPFNDMAQLPTYLISKFASEHVKVVLSGDGADELLGGYSTHRHAYNLANNKISTLDFMKLNIKYKVLRLLGIKKEKLRNRYYEQRELLKNTNFINRHYDCHRIITNKQLNSMGVDFTKNYLGECDFRLYNSVDDVLRNDATRYLPGALLVKSDRMTMANGLEIRLPFLEIDLAEFLLSMPYKYKINNEVGKLPLRKAYEDKWPELLRNRPKQGFSIPYALWYERNDFTQLRNEYLYNKNLKLYDYVDYKNVQDLINNPDKIMWNLLALSIWLENQNINSNPV